MVLYKTNWMSLNSSPSSKILTQNVWTAIFAPEKFVKINTSTLKTYNQIIVYGKNNKYPTWKFKMLTRDSKLSMLEKFNTSSISY